MTTSPFNIAKPPKDEAVLSGALLSTYDLGNVYNAIISYENQNCNMNKAEISIWEIHNIVESALESINPTVAQSYRNYRNYKTDFVAMLDKVYQESQKIMYIGDKENSNSDSALVSTKRSLIFNQLNKELYKKQKHMLDEFLQKGAISKAQYEKSLHDLTEKMRIK